MMSPENFTLVETNEKQKETPEQLKKRMKKEASEKAVEYHNELLKLSNNGILKFQEKDWTTTMVKIEESKEEINIWLTPSEDEVWPELTFLLENSKENSITKSFKIKIDIYWNITVNWDKILPEESKYILIKIWDNIEQYKEYMNRKKKEKEEARLKAQKEEEKLEKANVEKYIKKIDF